VLQRYRSGCTLARRLAPALLPFVLASPARAQRDLSLDVGAARVRYADTITTNTIALAPSFSMESRAISLRATGMFSQLGLGGWTSQGTLDASGYVPLFGPLMGEVTGALGGSVHRDATRTGQLLAGLRAHMVFPRFGMYAGGGLGGNWDGDMWRAVRHAEVGAWLRRNRFSLLLSVVPAEVQDTIDFTDASFSLSWQNDALEWAALAGIRSGDRLPALGGTERTWGSATLVVWVARRIALVAAGGAYPVDLTQGFPGGRFVSLGARLRSAPARPAAPIPAAALTALRADGADGAVLPVLEAKAAADGMYTLRLRAPRARLVEIAADFTDWQPLPLTAASEDWWTVTLRIDNGTHQLNARVDGGPWLVPGRLPVMLDEFGGRVGILVLTRNASGTKW
jgi:hypothetical protein